MVLKDNGHIVGDEPEPGFGLTAPQINVLLNELYQWREYDKTRCWRPMSEAPRDGTWVLVKIGRDYTPEQSCDVLRFGGGWWIDVHGAPGLTDKALAAWQPLPEPPTDEELEQLK